MTRFCKHVQDADILSLAGCLLELGGGKVLPVHAVLWEDGWAQFQHRQSASD